MEHDKAMESHQNDDRPNSGVVPIQFLQEEYNMFKSLPTDSSDIVWTTEFCKKSIINTDLILQQMIKEMIKTVHNLVHGLASEVIEKRSMKSLELIQQLRQDDVDNNELERVLGTTHNMSHELLERITGIISSSSSRHTPSTNSSQDAMAAPLSAQNQLIDAALQKNSKNDNEMMPPPAVPLHKN